MTDILWMLTTTGGVLIIALLIIDSLIFGRVKSPSWISIPGGLLVIATVICGIGTIISSIWS